MNEFRDEKMDALLQSALKAPVPTLKADWDQRVLEQAAKRHAIQLSVRRYVLWGYWITAAMTSFIVMRNVGISIGVTGGTLAVAAVIALAVLKTKISLPAANQG
ncbi:MAG: hypothetical protein JSS72_13680 [Armatimonadetes bacterium]|nr:hypothetical protein [Armatimonadota bacterium]